MFILFVLNVCLEIMVCSLLHRVDVSKLDLHICIIHLLHDLMKIFALKLLEPLGGRWKAF